MLKKIIAVIYLTACANSPKLIIGNGEKTLLDAKKVYTQTKLHSVEQRNRLYSINYQDSGFIPRCTEVEL
mgnify:CR=1 FL=1